MSDFSAGVKTNIPKSVCKSAMVMMCICCFRGVRSSVMDKTFSLII